MIRNLMNSSGRCRLGYLRSRFEVSVSNAFPQKSWLELHYSIPTPYSNYSVRPLHHGFGIQCSVGSPCGVITELLYGTDFGFSSLGVLNLPEGWGSLGRGRACFRTIFGHRKCGASSILKPSATLPAPQRKTWKPYCIRAPYTPITPAQAPIKSCI